MNKNFYKELQSQIAEVRTDSFSKHIYSVDASIFEIEPTAIAIPRKKQEVLALIDIAKHHQVSIIPRGAATGTTGGCIGEGLIIDLSKHFKKIHEINFESQFVRCDPGVTQDQLNQALSPHGYRLGPDTSTGNRATLGGMLANNSAGAHSIKYGRMVDHVLEVELALSSGELIHLHKLKQESKLYQNIKSIIEKSRDEIKEHYPKIPRHVSGYCLDELIEPGSFNLARLMAGSEGSLGIITEITLKICKKSKHKGLSVIRFNSLQKALESVPDILLQQPLSIELIDDKIIEQGRVSLTLKSSMSWLPDNPKAILLVEFEGANEYEVRSKHGQLISWMQTKHIGYAHNSYYNSFEIDQVWGLRKAGLGLIMSRRTYGKAIAFVEDLAVSPQKLAEFILEFKKCLQKHGLEAGFYGHAGAGCLHVRPFIDFRKEMDVQLMQKVMEEMTQVIQFYKGALSGEHGDGLIRSWLNERLFGTQIYQAFKDIKNAFDPSGLMNPGKIIANELPLKHLRFSPETVQPPITTFLDFKKEGGFNFAVEMCNGNGQCRKRDGLMCPTFQAYGDEYHSTRARAQALRSIVNGRENIEAFTSHELFNVLDLCIGCKGCKRECPSLIDMAKMKSEFLYHYQKKHGVSLRSRLFGHIGNVNSCGALLPNLTNRLIDSLPAKVLLNWIGISSKRAFPRLAHQRFSRVVKNLPKETGKKEIVLLIDTFTEFNSPQIAIAARQVLTRLGFTVITPPWHCCGRTLFSKGLLLEARQKGLVLIKQLLPFAKREIPILSLEPSCFSMLKDDYLTLLQIPSARMIADHCVLFDEFLLKELAGKRIDHLFNQIEQSVAVHTHCHQKALTGAQSTRQLLEILPYIEVSEMNTGCCGLAGSFGYEAEHYDFSMQIGEDCLFPAVRKLKEKTVILANGTSCRNQIQHGTQKTPLHLAEFLEKNLSLT